MLTKKLSLIALFSAAVLSVNAQNDPKAKTILDELSAKTKAYTSIKTEFTMEVVKKDKTKDTQTGKLATKGSKYKLEISGHEIYCDGKTVTEFIKDANEAQIKDMDASGDEVNPTNIFTLYEKGFKCKFDGEEGNTQTISLYPENPDKKKFHTVKLFIDKTKKQITGVRMLMKDQSTQTYTVKSFTPNAPLTDADFTFDKKAHPGVSIEDLR
jgi:outer membrane lipoprotein-sorting protein